MVDFKSLKKNRKKSLQDLAEEAKKVNTKNYDNDEENYWKPTRDKAGNGYAVIRFLPAGPKDPEDTLPWVKLYDHGFQGPTGKWYIENSRTTIGEADPVSEANSKLWDTGVESKREIARKRKRRLKYIANILVIKDSANPENEGKVFLYSFGPKIFSKIQNAMEPQFEDETPINPFDLWEGANFKLKIKTVVSDIGGKKVGLPNYDESSFDVPSAVADDDAEIERVFNETHSVAEIVDPKNFKPYDELQALLNRVWPDGPVGETAAPARERVAEPEVSDSTDEVPWSGDEDDDDASFFKDLVEDD